MPKTKEEIVDHLKEAESRKQADDLIAMAKAIADDKPEPASGLSVKLAYIMGQVKRLPKNGYNEFHKYAFPLEGDVSDMIREKLSEQHIAFYPEMVDYTCERVSTGRSEAWHFIVKHRFTFKDGDSGEERTMAWISEAMDTSDKAANKCATSGEKFFLLKTFLISSGDDPDGGGLEIKGAPKAPQTNGHTERPYKEKEDALRAAAKAKNIPWEPMVKYMDENGTNASSMTDAEANKWMGWTERQRVRE